ncbi:MAG: hypothetical protein J6S73_01005 [Lentisphaeria bacterium]|nr:hypothetical protein [Lentisphaeria bacterium]
MKAFHIYFLFLFSFSPLILLSGEMGKAKFIDLSWSNPSVGYLEKNLSRMQKEAFFLSGVTVTATGKERILANGKKFTPNSGNIWMDHPWKEEDFQDFILRIRKLKFKNFTDNFLYLAPFKVDFDWTDDKSFSIIAENFAVAARLAGKCGFKGFGLDLETYGKNFFHPRYKNKASLSLAEMEKIVYKRGKEWGEKVFAAFPDIVIIMPYGITQTQASAPLSCAFLNGVIHVMPEKVRLYEGFESDTYGVKSPAEMHDLPNRLRTLVKRHIREENLRKARGQFLLAPGFYMDAYFVHGPSSIYRKRLEPERSNKGPAELFKRVLHAAVEEADPYIWIYSERGSWWKKSQHPAVKKSWQEQALTATLPEEIAHINAPRKVRIPEKGNLVPCGTLVQKGKWELWQREDDRKMRAPGKVTFTPGRFTMRNVNSGCIHQSIPISALKTYFLLAGGGVVNFKSGKATVSINFMDAKGTWMPASQSVKLVFPASGKEEWVWKAFQAPAGAKKASLQFGTSFQQEGEEAFFTGMFLKEN